MVTLSRITVAAVLATAAAVPTAAHAQREVVQPLPPKGSDRLSDALRRLARNAADVSALLDAGEAALDVGDIDAAIGFFGRAKQLSPTNSRISLGLGKAYARSRRPIEALRLFAEAERAGVTNDRMAEDRGMAFMLVGDNRSAQDLFRLALAQGAGSEVKRRLALSHAISGERDSFEQTLLPLLEARDLAAFRTRAFGLAILGDTREAIDISDAMLPAQMAGRWVCFRARPTSAPTIRKSPPMHRLLQRQPHRRHPRRLRQPRRPASRERLRSDEWQLAGLRARRLYANGRNDRAGLRPSGRVRARMRGLPPTCLRRRHEQRNSQLLRSR